MEGKINQKYVWMNMICILVFAVVIIPLWILGYYNYPFADDWSLARITHNVVRENGRMDIFVKSIWESILLWRQKGEPRYASVLFASLQPGIWNEHYYRITTLLMTGGLCIAELLLGAFLLKAHGRENKKLILPILMPSIVIQLLCVPYPVECFYWYAGSVNYTFVFALSIILIVLFLTLLRDDYNKWRFAVIYTLCVILAVIVGGNNYATSLSTACILMSISCVWLFKSRKAFLRTLPITIITVAGLVVCLVAPGNLVRLNEEFGGTTTGTFYAIVMSLYRTGTNIISWTTLKIILMLVLIAPFMWMALKKVSYKFCLPMVFTLWSFGIYATQIVATMYVDGTTGGRRMADILYFAYHIWILINMGYWLGWFQRKYDLKNAKILMKIAIWVREHLWKWFVVSGLLLAMVVVVGELKTLSTYRACVWLVKGYAQDYASAWEERLELLNDDRIKEVYFEPLPGYEELVFYADFQQGECWVNDACEQYYNKNHVGLK